MLEVTDADFDKNVIEASKNESLVLVDFWAEWCGPCRSLAPIMEEVSAEMGSSVKVVKVNIDEQSGSTEQFDIRSIPTVLFFRDGKIVDRFVGMKSKSKIMEQITKAIDAAKQ